MVFYFCKKITVVQNWVKMEPPKDSFISSIPELLSNSKEILNSSSRSEENHISFRKFLKHSKVKTNFKSKGSVVEWKLATRKSFEKFSYVGVPSSPHSISISFTCVSPLVWEHKSKPMCIKTKFLKNQQRRNAT